MFSPHVVSNSGLIHRKQQPLFTYLVTILQSRGRVYVALRRPTGNL